MLNIHLIVLSLLLFGCCARPASKRNVHNDVINVGVIVDMGSWLGKVVESSITMAVKDFYNDNSYYKTRISLQIRDSMGDPLQSVSAAIDLLETLHVHALIMPIISNSELFIANLADKVHVPLLSFSSLPSFDEHPYYLQVAGDETTEFHGIATLSESFKWKECIILHEDTSDARQVQLTLHNILLENNIIVKYQAPISHKVTGYQIVDELQKIRKMETPIIIVHLSPSLMSQVLVNARKLGMMSKGFAWIVTSKTMNFLSVHDSYVHEVMQGVLGFRSYITSSSKLQYFTSRWIRESSMEIRELSVYGVWAYDAVWAVARAVEKADVKSNADGFKCNLLDSACLRISESGQALLTRILSSKFIGLAGVFELKNRTLAHDAYEIVNVIVKWERRVGLWTMANGLTMDINPSENLSSNSIHDTIIWPGLSLTTPASQSVNITGKTLRVLLPSRSDGTRDQLVKWRDETRTDMTAVDGLCVDVFVSAFDWLRYNVSFEVFPFHGSYNELVHQVFLQNYDAAVGDITILANRSAYVDFTCPFTDMGLGMVTKLDDKDPWFFLKPLDPGVWIMSACWFILMGALVWFIEHEDNEEFQGSSAWQVGTAMWFAISTLVFAHREKLKSNLSRFVVGVWLFVVLILTSIYTANLSSLLTVQKFKLTKSDYIGSANTLVRGHVVNNLNFRDDRLKQFQSVDEYVEPLRRGSKNDGVGAILDEMPYIKLFIAKYPDEFTIVETSLTTSGFGFAFQKGSPFVAELSRAIDGLREEGKLLEMEKKWFTKESPLLSQQDQTPSISTIGIYNLSGLFLISATSVLMALVVLLFISLEQRLFVAYLRLRAGVLLFLVGNFFPNSGNPNTQNPNIQNGVVQLAFFHNPGNPNIQNGVVQLAMVKNVT